MLDKIFSLWENLPMMKRYPSYQEKRRKQAEGIAFCEQCFKWKDISEFKLFNGGHPTATCRECYKPFKARAIINKRLREGTLAKPLICEGCGKKVESSKSIVAHHPDYNQPEYIQFLCRRCHFDAHKEMKQAQKKIVDWWSSVFFPRFINVL